MAESIRLSELPLSDTGGMRREVSADIYEAAFDFRTNSCDQVTSPLTCF